MAKYPHWRNQYGTTEKGNYQHNTEKEAGQEEVDMENLLITGSTIIAALWALSNFLEAHNRKRNPPPSQ